ncbi:hypothetical protein D1614_12600 [Maribellus luteus]|uniref:Signal transduction histidine kinase internal region domain-containing protein n=1 Tax=Maribellus luteus TaxID=2305463 RepID=A0A399T114_9BACT|nr:histidine kinase [Maribellus luteus]RIJ47957.1 hypothetical protein D1614_12600 [Maribellus luteus]
MKQKLLFIAILGIFISGNLFAKTGAVTPYNPEEKVYWDFLRERLFDEENAFVSSFQGDILIYLKGAGKQDSSIVENLMQELKKLIPDRNVRFSNKYYEVNANNQIIHSIHIGFNDEGIISSNGYVHHSKNISGNQIYYDGFKGIYQPDIFGQNVNVKFNDSISFTERKRYIEYAIVMSMCVLKGNPLEARTFFENAILNDFDYNPLNTEFSDVDKFVISKLYAYDFKEQFRNYMLVNYSWRYYLVFTYKSLMSPIAYLTCFLFAIVIFLVSYNPVLKRNYRNKYWSYLISGLLVTNTLIVAIVLYGFLATRYVILDSGYLIQWMILNFVSILLSSLLFLIEKVLVKDKLSHKNQLFLKVLSVFVIIVLPLSIALPFIDGYDNMLQVYLWIIGITIATVRGMVIYLKNIGALEVREKEVELVALKEANTRAEIQSLHARINPHFLYNSLNSIAGLAHRDADKTEKMALSLSDMFRYSLNRESKVMTEIHNEIEMVRSYLEIEQIRFGERMSFTIRIDEETCRYLAPKFILQPLVENAIKHGISKIESQGFIAVSIVLVNDKIEIKISDNGPGFSEGLVAGYGLQSLYDLLEICYKGEAEVNWQNSPDKYILVRIPSKSNSIEV